jgi:hypothetical protein
MPPIKSKNDIPVYWPFTSDAETMECYLDWIWARILLKRNPNLSVLGVMHMTNNKWDRLIWYAKITEALK